MIKSGPKSVFRDIFNQGVYDSHEYGKRIRSSTKDSSDFVQRLDLMKCFKAHRGCVNSICWNNNGQYILSGSDDQNIVITDPFSEKILIQYKTQHRANIFSAKFLPQSNDCGIVSCSGDGTVAYTELTGYHLQGLNNQIADGNLFNCHNNGTTYEVMTVPTEPYSFMSCGEDGTVRLFDLRQKSSCHKTCCKDNILIMSPCAITAMTISPISNQYIAVGGSDSLIRIYDRRYLSLIDFSTTVNSTPSDRHTTPVKVFTIPTSIKRSYRVTSVKYSADEQQLLVSYSSDYLYLFDATKEGTDLKALKSRRTYKRERQSSSPPPVRKLRLRGDWSDTGPDARPERYTNARIEMGQVRPVLQNSIMSRMTAVLEQMLSDPRTGPRINYPSYDDSAIYDHTARELANLERVAGVSNTAIPSTSAASIIASTSSSSSTASASTQNQKNSSSIYSNNKNNDNDDDDDDDDDDDIESASGASSNVNNRENGDKNHIGALVNKNEKLSLQEEIMKIEMESKELSVPKLNFDYIIRKYDGHRNARTMIKEASFWGEDHVMSGSDCGHVFIWNRHTGKLEMLLRADQHVVNCLQPHPTLPFLATSGIDYDIKLWGPIRNENGFNQEFANDLLDRNAVMLEQTKDTITVPAYFMMRMLSCLHNLRNQRYQSSNNNESTTNNSNSNNEQRGPNN